MIIGLLGAHRTGKTTLAAEFCRKNPPFRFAPTSVSKMMTERGFDPAKDYPIVERLAIQNIILDGLDRFYSSHERDTVFDRTPLDAAAYMLADVRRENVETVLQKEITDYVARAIDITNRRFAMVLFVPPVLKLVHEEGKAPAEPAYVEHISQIISGLKSDERMKVRWFSMPRGYVDLDIRVKAMQNAATRTLSNYLAETEALNLNGVEFH
jgi:hypothetical protein